jgi:acyl-coenzyme A synthetase/AMP-(fatty) acid ligase
MQRFNAAGLPAYVILRPNEVGTDRLVRDLQDFVKREIAPYKYPREIEFVSELPRTSSGKISRRALREAKAASSA